MHCIILPFINLAAAIPLANLLFDEDPDLNLETSVASTDLFDVYADSDLFPEVENAPDFLLADTGFCLSDDDDNDDDDFLLTRKIRRRDSCPSTGSADPTLQIPTFNLAPPSFRNNEHERLKRLQQLFGADSFDTPKNYDGSDACPEETTFGSMIPVCDSGNWADALRQPGGDYTLLFVRPCSVPPFIYSSSPISSSS